jgi:hypothetical protein
MQRAYGGGAWIKLLPAARWKESSSFRFPLMILDPDVILLGPVFEELMEVEGSVVVAPDIMHTGEFFSLDYISRQYLSVEKLKGAGVNQRDIESFPWFNAGQYFMREPFIEPAFIHEWANWDSAPITRRDPDFYPLTENSLLNHYLLLNKQIPLGVVDFMEFAGDQLGWHKARQVSQYKTSKSKVLHYAGHTKIPFWKMPCWRPFWKENFAAERAMGNIGSLICSHGMQYMLRGVLKCLGEKRRNSLKQLFWK